MPEGWPPLMCPIFLSSIQDVFVISCLSLELLVPCWFPPRWKGSQLFLYYLAPAYIELEHEDYGDYY